MRNFLILSVSFMLSFIVNAHPVDNQLNVLSFNIRYNTPNDGDNAWPHRKQHVSQLIQFHQAQVIGLQEATFGQLKDLESLLPSYKWLGLARDDGKQDSSGEYAAILYNSESLTVSEQGSFWCSTTPTVPSKGWDTSLPRNVNWAKLTHKTAGDFYLFNAHFDHVGEISRAECAKLLRSEVDKIAGDSAVIVMGDFNSKPTDPPYERLTEKSTYQIPLFDAKTVSALKPYGPQFTFTNFDLHAKAEQPIDYIFVSKNIKVNRFGVLSDYLNGRLPSDHYPILVDVSLAK